MVMVQNILKEDNGFDVYEGPFQNGKMNGSGSFTLRQ